MPASAPLPNTAVDQRKLKHEASGHLRVSKGVGLVFYSVPESITFSEVLTAFGLKEPVEWRPSVEVCERIKE